MVIYVGMTRLRMYLTVMISLLNFLDTFRAYARLFQHYLNQIKWSSFLTHSHLVTQDYIECIHVPFKSSWHGVYVWG
jgi:hypothetical protein